MAKSKKKNKNKKKSNPETTERNKKIALMSAIVLGTAGVFVSAGMGIKTLDQRAATLVTDQDPQVQINWGQSGNGHVWMPIAERDRIEAKVQASLVNSKALSWHPLYQASKALQATGWVNGEPTARWTEEGSIIIDADWRVPAAAVRKNGRDFIIDFDANVLPLDYAADQSNQLIIHNPALPFPGTGNQWNEPEILDALKLFSELQAKGLLSQIVGIDLGTQEEHGILQLLTDNNARIMFGGGPGRSRPAEMPSTVKIDRLASLLNKTGRIDAGGMILDVRGPEISMQRHEN